MEGGQGPMHFSEIIREVLEFVNKFIAPSRAGTIYIDDPSTRTYDENGNLDYGATSFLRHVLVTGHKVSSVVISLPTKV